MDENICEQCGTRNEPGAQFCVECQAFLPWYDTTRDRPAGLGIDTGTGTAAAGSQADVAPTAPVVEDAAPPVTPSAEALADAAVAGAGTPSPGREPGQRRRRPIRRPVQVRPSIEGPRTCGSGAGRHRAGRRGGGARR